MANLKLQVVEIETDDTQGARARAARTGIAPFARAAGLAAARADRTGGDRSP